MRIAAFAQSVVLVALAAAVLCRAGLAMDQWRPASGWLVWIAVGLSAVSLVLNAITPSAGERRVWLPVAGLMLISSTVVAVGVG
jgi:hypothetical protein